MPVKNHSVESSKGVSRRDFMQQAAIAASISWFPPGVSGCKAMPEAQSRAASTASNAADVMEQALEILAPTGPEYSFGLANHGPMAAEALIAMGRAEAVIPWVERYKRNLQSPPEARRAIVRQEWREALGAFSRAGDWVAFFTRELKEAPWRAVLGEWTVRLAPGLAAAAAHGLIRAAHAARSLAERETEARRRELAEGLGYWAARYQPLPMARNRKPGGMKPSQAVRQIEILPTEQRARGLIANALRRLDNFPPFAGVADMVDCSGDASRFLSDLTETFAMLCLTQPGRLIAFIHAVTGPGAIRLLLPHLTPEARQSALRYGWQMAAAIYAAFGSAAGAGAIEDRKQDKEDLIGRAVTNGDEHAIKFTEACLREHALNPKSVYLLAARHAIDRLPPATSS